MVNLTSVQMWSEKAQAIVEWTITQKQEIDEGGNKHQIIAVEHEEEIQRFSPSFTTEELLAVIGNINKQH